MPGNKLNKPKIFSGINEEQFEVRPCFGAEFFVFQFSIQNLRFNIYKIIILPVVAYGCETWSLTLRDERTLRVFDNRMLWRIFGLERVEVTGEWRKLHNDEFNYLYCSPNIVRVIKSRRMRWAVHVARMGGEE